MIWQDNNNIGDKINNNTITSRETFFFSFFLFPILSRMGAKKSKSLFFFSLLTCQFPV